MTCRNILNRTKAVGMVVKGCDYRPMLGYTYTPGYLACHTYCDGGNTFLQHIRTITTKRHIFVVQLTCLY